MSDSNRPSRNMGGQIHQARRRSARRARAAIPNGPTPRSDLIASMLHNLGFVVERRGPDMVVSMLNRPVGRMEIELALIDAVQSEDIRQDGDKVIVSAQYETRRARRKPHAPAVRSRPTRAAIPANGNLTAMTADEFGELDGVWPRDQWLQWCAMSGYGGEVMNYLQWDDVYTQIYLPAVAEAIRRRTREVVDAEWYAKATAGYEEAAQKLEQQGYTRKPHPVHGFVFVKAGEPTLTIGYSFGGPGWHPQVQHGVARHAHRRHREVLPLEQRAPETWATIEQWMRGFVAMAGYDPEALAKHAAGRYGYGTDAYRELAQRVVDEEKQAMGMAARRRHYREQDGELQPAGTIAPVAPELERGDPAVIELPPDAAVLPHEAQVLWLETYVTYLEDGEEPATHQAWTAVYDASWKQDDQGQWYRDETTEMVVDTTGQVGDIVMMPEGRRRARVAQPVAARQLARESFQFNWQFTFPSTHIVSLPEIDVDARVELEAEPTPPYRNRWKATINWQGNYFTSKSDFMGEDEAKRWVESQVSQINWAQESIRTRAAQMDTKICPVCGREITIGLDGLFWDHGMVTDFTPGGPTDWCPMSKKKPTDVVAARRREAQMVRAATMTLGQVLSQYGSGTDLTDQGIYYQDASGHRHHIVRVEGVVGEPEMAVIVKPTGLSVGLDIRQIAEPHWQVTVGESRRVQAKRVPDRGSTEWHQHQIAVDTVKNPTKGMFLGGPSADEAEEILRDKFGYTDADIQALKSASRPVRAVMFGGWEPALSAQEMRGFERLGAYTVSGGTATPDPSYPDFPGPNPPIYKWGLAMPNDPHSQAWIMQASRRPMARRVRAQGMAWSPAEVEYKGYTIRAVGTSAVIYPPGSRQAVWELSITDWDDTVAEAKAWIDQHISGLASHRQGRRLRMAIVEKPASQLKVGDKIYERNGGGMEFEIAGIEPSGDKLVLTLSGFGTVTPGPISVKPTDMVQVWESTRPVREQEPDADTYRVYFEDGTETVINVLPEQNLQDVLARLADTEGVDVVDYKLEKYSAGGQTVHRGSPRSARERLVGERVVSDREHWDMYLKQHLRQRLASAMPSASVSFDDGSFTMTLRGIPVNDPMYGEGHRDEVTADVGRASRDYNWDPVEKEARRVGDTMEYTYGFVSRRGVSAAIRAREGGRPDPWEPMTEWEFANSDFAKGASGDRAGNVHAWLWFDQGYPEGERHTFGEWMQIMSGYPYQWNPDYDPMVEESLKSARPYRRIRTAVINWPEVKAWMRQVVDYAEGIEKMAQVAAEEFGVSQTDSQYQEMLKTAEEVWREKEMRQMDAQRYRRTRKQFRQPPASSVREAQRLQTKKHTAAWHRCVGEVKAKGGGKYNPYAVCTWSLERPGGEEVYKSARRAQEAVLTLTVEDARKIDDILAEEMERAGVKALQIDTETWEITEVPAEGAKGPPAEGEEETPAERPTAETFQSRRSWTRPASRRPTHRRTREAGYYIWVEVQGSPHNPEQIDEATDLEDARYLLQEYQLVYRSPNRVWVGDENAKEIDVWAEAQRPVRAAEGMPIEEFLAGDPGQAVIMPGFKRYMREADWYSPGDRLSREEWAELLSGYADSISQSLRATQQATREQDEGEDKDKGEKEEPKKIKLDAFAKEKDIAGNDLTGFKMWAGKHDVDVEGTKTAEDWQKEFDKFKGKGEEEKTEEALTLEALQAAAAAAIQEERAYLGQQADRRLVIGMGTGSSDVTGGDISDEEMKDAFRGLLPDLDDDQLESVINGRQ